MKISKINKLRYWFENFMARGGVAIFISLLVLFIISLVLTFLIRIIFLAFDPTYDVVGKFLSNLWHVFLGLTDPGTLMEETGKSIWLKLAGIVTIFFGLVIFSMLIAFITTQVETTIYNFRKGKSKVIEQDHTLIIGWNERVFDILKELIIANESKKRASVVILANEDKEMMDDEIAKQISDAKTTKIITRSEDTSSFNGLKRVNVQQAISAIILASCPDSASDEDKEISDIKMIKTILAILARKKDQDNITVIAEIFSHEKRKLIQELDFKNVLTINSWEILGKLMVQTSLSSGLETVYNEILSFSGCEVYSYKADWEGKKFGELAYHFSDGIPMGILQQDGSMILRPPANTKMNKDDQIFILADDDSTISFDRQKIVSAKDYAFTMKRAKKKKEKELILGWHTIASIVISEYANYLLKGSQIDVMIDDPSPSIKNKIDNLKRRQPSLKIRLIDKNPMLQKNLQKVNPFSYHNIIILAQDEENYSPEKVDSDTMLILLLLRKISETIKQKKGATKIITQVLNSENQELIQHSNVDDFIISNKMITMIIAQLSENINMKQFYDHLFSEEGSEIYLKPATYYFNKFPQTLKFADIIHAAQKREEICLGLRKYDKYSDPKANYGVILNPDKKATYSLTQEDFLVVFAEDEL